MHIAVTWDISTSGDNWSSINERMRDVLKPYSWARPLSTFYVVKVNGEHDRTAIKEGLTAIASSSSSKIHFVVTPLMSSGSYDGYLPKDMWDNINQRTS